MMKKVEIGIFVPKQCPHRCSKHDTIWVRTEDVDENAYYVCDHIKNMHRKPVVCDDEENFPADCVLEDYLWHKES